MRTVALTKESTKDILENLLKRSPNNYANSNLPLMRFFTK